MNFLGGTVSGTVSGTNRARPWDKQGPSLGQTEIAFLGREVLHGVGADGVGVKFPIFAVNCCCLPLSFRRSREKCEEKGEKCVQKGEKRVKKRGKSLRPHLHQPH